MIHINKIIWLVLAVIVVGAAFILMSRPSQQTPTSVSSPVTTGNTVTIQNFSFSPDTLTIKQGAKVTWINQDTATHTIKSDTFNSSDLNTGDKFEFTFNTKGTFNYICGIHPSMKGQIVVE